MAQTPVALSSSALYELADALGMTITRDEKGELDGVKNKIIPFGKLLVTLPVEVVSSRIDGKLAMVILSVTGNLCLFATVDDRGGGRIITVHILDLAKMDKVTGWLEKNKPATIELAKKALGPAIVASFRRVKLKHAA